MTNPEPAEPETVRTDALIDATMEFIQKLTKQGVETIIVGYALSEDPQGQGVFKLMGKNPAIILNLVAALISGLVPEDFHNLLITMQRGDYFARQRGENIQPMDPKKVN